MSNPINRELPSTGDFFRAPAPTGRRDDSYARVLGPGHFAGRGPRNYRRSDARVREDVCDALTTHPEVDASGLEIEVHDGEVTLRGSVDDRRMKRLAVATAESVAGVRDVHTAIRVEPR